jgi:hypothetical protein
MKTTPVKSRSRHFDSKRALPTCGTGRLHGSAWPLPAAVPHSVRLGLGTQAPECQTGVGDSNYAAPPLCLAIEVGVPQKAAGEHSHFILSDARHNYAVSRSAAGSAQKSRRPA